MLNSIYLNLSPYILLMWTLMQLYHWSVTQNNFSDTKSTKNAWPTGAGKGKSMLALLSLILCYQEFCGKLMEVVRVAPSELQREIVTCLPDIVDDPQHDDAAILLKWVCREILDCGLVWLENPQLKLLYPLDQNFDFALVQIIAQWQTWAHSFSDGCSVQFDHCRPHCCRGLFSFSIHCVYE